MLRPFNAAPHVLTPTIKLFSMLLQNCNFSTVMSHNINTWYVGYLIFNPCERVVWPPPPSKGSQPTSWELLFKRKFYVWGSFTLIQHTYTHQKTTPKFSCWLEALMPVSQSLLSSKMPIIFLFPWGKESKQHEPASLSAKHFSFNSKLVPLLWKCLFPAFNYLF